MKTELILFHRPFNQILPIGNPAELTVASQSTFSFDIKGNPNEVITKSYQTIVRNNSNGVSGVQIDLYDNVSIPITYTILDVREPEKRKTNWSKTITIPGTKNNNRIFSHIYQISQDGWITIGNTSVYEGFNPNLRRECILLNDGIQVFKGNLQLKKIVRSVNGDIEYEVAISGDLTSLFYDVGNAKLSDLDLSEWDHDWSKDNIEASWEGISKRNNQDFNSIVNGSPKTISKIFIQQSTGRLAFETSTSHALVVDDWVRINPDLTLNERFDFVNGEWQVTEVISANQFAVNYFYPVAMNTAGYTGTLGTCVKRTATGRGYVYPMISWGDEYDENSFPVTSFVPGFYVKELWDKIFKETKSSYSSEFLNSQFFKRLILIQKKASYDINPGELATRKFWVGTTQSYLTGASYLGTSDWFYTQVNTTSTATASIFPTTNPQRFPFKSESGSFGTVSFYDSGLTENGSLGNWDNTTYKWVVEDTGEYDLTAVINLTAWADINGFGTSPGGGTAGMTPSTYRYYPGSGSEYWTNSYTSGPGPYTSQNPYQFGMQVEGTIKRLRNGVVTEIGKALVDFKMNNSSYWTPDNPNWVNFGRYQPPGWRNNQLTVTSGSKYFTKGDEVWVELRHFVQAYAGSPGSQAALGRKTAFCFNQSGGPEIARAVLGEFYLRVESQSYIFNTPSPKTTENANLEAASIVPKDMTAKDFLLSIIKMFNLHIEQDRQVDRKYFIEPRDDYYYDGSSQTQFQDWTDKLDESSVEMIPMGELIAKYYTFENKEETDYWNKRFKEDRGRGYMSYTKEINNDFLTNETKISVPLGSTVMINNPAGSDVVMPAILQREANGSFKPVSNSQPRVLIWGGMRPYTAQRGGAKIRLSNPAFPDAFGWELLSGSQSTEVSASSSYYTTYPYAGTVDSPADPIRDINWYNMERGDFVYYDNARWTNENLYNKYWSNFINEISDPTSKVIIASLKLDPKDIYDLNFRKIYVLDGNYLRLQKVIDYDPISDGLTRCEFLKLKSPVKFSRQSIIVDSYGTVNNQFVTYVDNTRPVPVIETELAPSRKRPEFGFMNSNAGANLSNSVSVQTNGYSNFISPGVKNVSITGNENSIGDSCENIQVSGNGNFITGGLKNVNLIGTDKKFISESNVTYINGIRYVNGQPVSKANVIDGGQDVAVVRQSANTTPNVVDAAEDVVIEAGTTTFENVINAGQDQILPDVADLGISTIVNPNPRTNLTSGSGFEPTSESMVDIIRTRTFLR